jgi:hypothetical protein
MRQSNLLRIRTHEDLQEKAHIQDLQIQALLVQLDQLKTDNRIKEWMARSQFVDHPNSGLSDFEFDHSIVL